MAYLGLSPDTNYPDQYFTSPGERLTCGDYCATKKAGIVPIEYLLRPEGCTCPDEVDAKKQGFYEPRTIQLTPQQIEAQVKREQSPMALYVIGAIAAYLLLMR